MILEYCKLQNNKGNTPHFLIADNPDFEYVASLHDIEYKGQDTKNFIVNAWKFKDIAAFKSNEDVYEFLNSGRKSFRNLLDAIFCLRTVYRRINVVLLFMKAKALFILASLPVFYLRRWIW